jgi:hypothetical protein
VIDEANVVAVMDALDSSEARCPDFYRYLDGPDTCDGLDGCPRCLRRAAKAVLKALAL